MEILKQDYRLKEGDLHYTFYSDSVAYPYGSLPQKYSPYWVRYEIGQVQEDNLSYYPKGSLFRLPVEVETGIFRPNFIIGPDWDVGLYKIRWKYKKSAGTNVEYADISFYIATGGLYDYSKKMLGGFLDLPADLNIID